MTGTLKDVSFLVVDDQEHMCHIIREILYAFGARRIVTAGRVDKALEKYERAQPDIVITDYRMKPVDGIEFARYLRLDKDSPDPYVPIIMMTADATKNVVSQAMEVGVHELLVKPIKPIDIWKRVESVVMTPPSFIRTEGYFGPDRRRHPVTDVFETDPPTEQVELL